LALGKALGKAQHRVSRLRRAFTAQVAGCGGRLGRERLDVADFASGQVDELHEPMAGVGTGVPDQAV